MRKPDKWGRTWEFARLFSREWQCLANGGCGDWLYTRRTDVPDENRHRLFQFIYAIDMDDACGSDNKGHPKYVCELSEVHLDEIGETIIEQARKSCGCIRIDSDYTAEQLALQDAEMCFQYGARAPMGSWEGNGLDRLLRRARQEANQLDARNGANIFRAARLHMPVNRIGTSALAFMRGDLVTDTAGVPGMASVPSQSVLKWKP